MPLKPLKQKRSDGWLFLLWWQVFGPSALSRNQLQVIKRKWFLHYVLYLEPMKDRNDKKWIAIIILIASLVFFVMGFMYPLLQSGFSIGPFTIKSDYVYISTSFRYFFDKGEIFIGLLLLFFTIIFPIIKYIFLFITLLGRKLPRHSIFATALEIINKWSMLDVFVVAVLILNMKFDSSIIVSKLEAGTTLFAVSVVLLMTSSFIARKMIIQKEESGK